MKIKYVCLQNDDEFNIKNENIIATNMFDRDYGSGELIPHLEIWYVDK